MTLKAVTAWPTNYPTNAKFLEWVKNANEKGKGQFVINVVGGPEAVPYSEQIQAIKNGVIDFANTAGGYYTNQIPEVYAFQLSRLNPDEERKNGFYDLMAKIHQEKGLIYMGRALAGVPMGYLFINIPAKSTKDLAGLKIRSEIVYDPIIKEVKAVPVTMPIPDIYNAMQQHVIDGFIKPLSSGFVSLGLHEVTKYLVNHTLYRNPTVAIGRLETWNKLPESARKILTDTFIEMESTAVAYAQGIDNNELKKGKDAGLQLIDFPADDAKWFIDTAYKLAWDVTLPKCPQYGAQLQKLSTK